VRGTGVQGSITLADVDRAARAPSAPASPAAESTIIARDRSAEMRRTIGAAMARAKREIPHYYLADPIPLGQATAWLSTYNAGRSVTDRVLMAALLLKAVARAARTCPDLNGHYVDGRFTAAPAVHVGVAISVRGGGLIAPAIRDVDRLAIDALMRALTDLVARARAGRLRSSELSDATISVTNLGDQGVGEVYGIIYPPQVALVGFGRITEDVVAEGGAIRTMPVVRASLSADHRVSDGHTGALFLARIRTLLQSPAALVEDVS
jgi:pyruvate dehydrogenase E2 component (dihydrolipoamide acetyltransferase)